MSDNREHMHYLEFSCQSIELTGKIKEMLNGSFVIHATDRYASGKIYSSDTRMKLIISEFRGQQIVVQYCFDGVTVESEKVINGEFIIISNYGEYTIPFKVNVQKPKLDSSLGEIKNLFHFTNLAQSNWTEAVEMFYSPDFKTIFQNIEGDLYLSYLGLSHFIGNEQNLEEFLIEINKKTPVIYSFDIEGFILEDIQDSITKTITITKNTWGYTYLRLKTESDFLRISVQELTNEDFKNNIYSFTFEIDASMLHKGMNNGKIIFYDASRSYIIPVDILMENEQEKRDKNRCKKLAIRSIVKNYVDMKFRKKTKEQWIDITSKDIDKLSELDEDNIMVKLYNIQMLITKERFNEAKSHLDSLENEIYENNTDDIISGYYLYLTTLFNRDENYIHVVCDEISVMYANNPSNWWLAWFLMHLNENYIRNNEQKWKLLEQLFKNGCISPIVLCEAVILLQSNPTFLLKLDSFEETVLWHAARNKMLKPDLIEQVQYLTARKKEYSSLLFRVLTEVYKVYKSPQTIAAICRLLIIGDKKGSEYFYWYKLGVEHSVRVTKLYEYYMMSLKLDKHGNISGDIGEIPKMVLMYFAYQSTLDYERNAFLYAYIIKNKDKYPDLEQSYRIAIERFVVEQVKSGHINENLAYLYHNVLVHQMIVDETAYAFTTLLFMHCIYVDDSNMKNVIIIHEKVNGESSYPIVNNVCMFPIYGNEYKLFLQDEYGNRFTKSVGCVDKQLMEPKEMLSFVGEYMKGRLSFDIYLCELEKNYIIITPENVKRYKNLAESPQVIEGFKKEIRTKLLRYYYDNDMIGELDTFLEEIEADEMEVQERAEFIRYLISRGMFDKAYLWIRRYGIAGVNPKSLARLISKNIITKDYEYDEFLVNVSYYIYENMKYDESILYYLLLHYEGKLTDLRKLWKTAVELELDTKNVMYKILQQIKYTGVTIQEKDEILIEYAKHEDCDFMLVKEMLITSAYEYFVYDTIVLPEIFDKIYQEYYINKLDDKVCKLAMLKFWSEEPEYLDKIPDEIVIRLIKEFLREEIYFSFYQRFAYIVPDLHYLKDRVFIEHKTASGKKVSIHYMFEDLCCNTAEEDNLSNNDDGYEILEMKEMYDGIYVSMFMLFHGEAIQYYITESQIVNDEMAEENIVVSDVLFGDIESEEKSIQICKSIENRYMMLNDIMTSIDMKDELTEEQLIEEYLYKDFCTRELFRIL